MCVCVCVCVYLNGTPSAQDRQVPFEVCVCVSLDGKEGVKARPALLGSLRRKVL